MKLKSISALLILATISNGLLGQDTLRRKIKEYYFSISYFSPLVVQIKYKKQIQKNIFSKIGLIDVSYGSSYGNNNGVNGFADHTSEGYSAGIELGLEMRKKLFEKLSFYHGPNLSFTYSHYKFRSYNNNIQAYTGGITESYNGAIPYTFGLLISLSSHFFLSAEVNPTVSYNTSQSKNLPYTVGNKSYGSSFNFGLGNRGGVVSLVYRK